MTEIVIDITQQGEAEALHMDEFDLFFLGKAKVTRASHIIFDVFSQSWFILLPDQEEPFDVLTGFKKYGEARDFEVDWLQECRKQGINPLSKEGEQIAIECKKKCPSPKQRAFSW